MQLSNRNIVFFDGVCNLCNGFVSFLLKVDRDKNLYFSSLQSQTATELLSTPTMDTVVFYKESVIYTKSDAVIEIFKSLHPFLAVIVIFKIIPKRLRDYLYMTLSKYRYSLFGKRDTCRLPTESELKRFL